MHARDNAPCEDSVTPSSPALVCVSITVTIVVDVYPKNTFVIQVR